MDVCLLMWKPLNRSLNLCYGIAFKFLHRLELQALDSVIYKVEFELDFKFQNLF